MAARTSGRSGADARPTLADVARLAGVSPMTASRALNSEKYVSAQSAQKVREAADELDFVPHHGARSLAKNRADTIGLILPMAGTRFFNDPNIAPILAGASARLAELESQLIVLIAGDERQAAKVRKFVLARHVDGALVISPEIIPGVVADLATAGVPLAVTGSAAPRAGIDVVDVDTAASVRTAYAHLAERGCRLVGLITGPDGDPPTVIQRGAFSSVGGDTARIGSGDYSEASGRRAMRDLLQRHPDLDGVLVMSDVMARGALRVLREAGRNVPSDFRVVGYDDSRAASSAKPALSTVRVPFESIGAEMARLVLERVEDQTLAPRRVTMPTQLVVRSSS